MLQATVQNRVTVGDRTYYGTTREKFITQTCQWHISRVLPLQPQQQVRARIRMNESRRRQQIFAIEFLYNILMFVQHPDAAAVCFYMRAGVASNDIVGLLMVCRILATHHVYGRLIGLDVLYVQTPPTIFLFVNKDRRIFCTSSASRVVTRHMHHEAISRAQNFVQSPWRWVPPPPLLLLCLLYKILLFSLLLPWIRCWSAIVILMTKPCDVIDGNNKSMNSRRFSDVLILYIYQRETFDIDSFIVLKHRQDIASVVSTFR